MPPGVDAFLPLFVALVQRIERVVENFRRGQVDAEVSLRLNSLVEFEWQLTGHCSVRCPTAWSVS